MKFILKKLKIKKTEEPLLFVVYRIRRKGKITTVQGNLKGTISNKIIGKKGFGYDPIFIPKGKNITFGQMSKIKKIKMDHRFLAFKNF